MIPRATLALPFAQQRVAQNSNGEFLLAPVASVCSLVLECIGMNNRFQEALQEIGICEPLEAAGKAIKCRR
jgi:hypothetical protein